MPRSDPFSSAWEGVRLVQSKCARLTAWLGVQGCAATALSLCFSVHARARGHRDAWADASGPGISAEVVMCLRWTAAGMLEAERQFRRVTGYRDLAKLALAAERELHRHPIQEVAVTVA